MKHLILALNYAPEPVGCAVYTTGLAEALADAGDEVRVIAARPFYPDWQSRIAATSAVEDGVHVRRVRHYIPARPTGFKRILHQISFALSALIPTVWTAVTWRPDRVIMVAPALLAAPVAIVAAKLGGARSHLHVQDLEVQAAMATGLIPATGLVSRAAQALERRLLSGFDSVSTISAQMASRLREKGVERSRLKLLGNWADTDGVRPLSGPSIYRRIWQIETPYVALYSGNLAGKQGMETVVEAARLLHHRDDLTVVICGEGPRRADLARQASGLENVRFYDLQPSERLSELLGLATLHLLPQIAGAADLLLPSKLGNMLASGRPIVATATPGTGLHEAVTGCGLVTPPGDAAALAEAIATLLDDPLAWDALGHAARQRAMSDWNKSDILTAFTAELHMDASKLDTPRLAASEP